MQVKVMGFEVLKELYKDDPFFRKIWEECLKGPYQNFLMQDEFLFMKNCLCIPECFLREAIIIEAHGGGLVGYFGRDKTFSLVKENFYWPKLERDVMRHIEKCRTCYIFKSHAQNTSLYTPLSISIAP